MVGALLLPILLIRPLGTPVRGADGPNLVSVSGSAARIMTADQATLGVSVQASDPVQAVAKSKAIGLRF